MTCRLWTTAVRRRSLLADLPTSLRDCVRVEESHLSLDLSDCALDVQVILDLAHQMLAKADEAEAQNGSSPI